MQIGIRAWALLAVLVAGIVGVGAFLLSSSGPAGEEPLPESVALTAPEVAPQDVAKAPGEGTAPAAATGNKRIALQAPSPPPRDEAFVIKRILPISEPIRYGEWHWDDAGVPDGPLVITVDLQARVLSVFRGGYEIGATAVLLGTTDKPTPLGVFPIKWKQAEHYSSTYDNAPMPFTMRLTDDGVAIHGTKVENGYASHGCVGTPTPFAKKLFAIARVGDKVYVTRGKMVGVGDSLKGS